MSLHESSRFALNGKWLRKQHPAAARYAFAFVLTGSSAAVGLWLRPATYQVPYLFFYAAILLSVVYGGFGPGLASTILSAVLVNRFFQPPYGEFSYDFQSLSRGVYFCLSFGIICWLIDSRWRRAGSRIETQLQLLDMAADPILMCDEDDRILYWNKGAESVYGWSREEAIGRRIFDFLHTIYPKPLQEIKSHVLSEGRWRGELRRTAKDGCVLLIASSWTLRPNSGNGFIRLETDHDITEQRKVEERLRESEEHYRDLVEHSSDLICTHSLDGRFLYVNELSAKILGYSREEMLGKPMRDFLIPEARPQFDAALLTIQKVGSLKGKMVVVAKNGERRIWEYHNTLRSEGMAVPIVRGIAHDITDQKRTEVALRESETKFSTAFHSSSVAQAIATLGGKLVEVNEAFCGLTGYTREEIIGNTSIKIGIMTTEERAKMLRAIETAGGALKDAELTFCAKDGSLHDIVQSIATISLGGVPHRLATMIDETKRNQAENELRVQTEQLRALSVRLQKTREEERTIVARELHDEIGQVLTGLKLDMSWIARRLPEDKQELREKIESTLTLANAGMGWVRKICTELRPGILDDLGLAAAIEWQAKEFEARTAIHCKVSLPAENVDLDQERSTAVFRIFQEALTNVSRHSKATQVEVSLREENDTILLIIRDNGIGIQATQGQPGRSFGLLGMRERALVFGGKVEFSGAGGGTTVTVSILHPRVTLVNSKNSGKDANSDRR